MLLDKVGLDGVTFLRFLRMLAYIFLGIAIITCGALIPINVTYNFKNVEEDKRNTLSILTIENVEGTTLFFRKFVVPYTRTLFSYILHRCRSYLSDQFLGTWNDLL